MSVPVRPKQAYKNLQWNLAWMLRDVPEVAKSVRYVRGTNQAARLTTRSGGRFEVQLTYGWRWRTPVSFTTAAVGDDALPAGFHPARGTYAVRPGDGRGGGAVVEVVVEVDGVPDEDPAVGAMLDHGLAVLAPLVPRRRVTWY